MNPVRCLMSLNQREAVLAAIPKPAGRMLEWGSGGTTLWLADRLAPGQSLTSVEHHPQWASQVAAAVGKRPNWEMRHLPPGGEVGANATPWEECPANLDAYLDQPVAEYDAFLIDGVARGACLTNVLLKARTGAVVLLHDTQRTWYEWAIRVGRDRIASREPIDPTPGDYPSLMTRLVLK